MSDKEWIQTAKNVLEGRTITEVTYLTTEEAQDQGWYRRPVVIQLDNGTLLIPQSDDEGNDGGAIFYHNSKVEDGSQTGVLPVL